jgi:hypothetical protein
MQPTLTAQLPAQSMEQFVVSFVTLINEHRSFKGKKQKEDSNPPQNF